MKSLIFFIPVIGGVTGWLILSLALKLVFHPQKPVRLWGNVFFQGLIPGKQTQLALGLREILETQLLYAVSKDAGTAPEVFNTITASVACTVKQRIAQKLPGILPTVVRDKISGTVEEIVRREVPGFLEAIIENIRNKNDKERDLLRVLEEKIKFFDTGPLEKEIAHSREALYLKAGGAFIGFTAGLLQLVVAWVSLT